MTPTPNDNPTLIERLNALAGTNTKSQDYKVIARILKAIDQVTVYPTEEPPPAAILTEQRDELRGLRVTPHDVTPESEKPTGGGDIPPPTGLDRAYERKRQGFFTRYSLF